MTLRASPKTSPSNYVLMCTGHLQGCGEASHVIFTCDRNLSFPAPPTGVAFIVDTIFPPLHFQSLKIGSKSTPPCKVNILNDSQQRDFLFMNYSTIAFLTDT